MKTLKEQLIDIAADARSESIKSAKKWKMSCITSASIRRINSQYDYAITKIDELCELLRIN